MNKVILNFPDGFLERLGIEENQHYEIMRRGLGSMFFLARPAGKNQIVAFLGGEKSIEIEKIEPEADRTAAAVKYVLPFFEEVEGLGKITGGDIKNAHFTTWYKDEFARGAYSVPVVGAANARAEMFKPIEDKIFFAGEACATGGWATQVHGAMETGRQAAENISEAIKRKAEHSATIAAEPPRSWEKK